MAHGFGRICNMRLVAAFMAFALLASPALAARVDVPSLPEAAYAFGMHDIYTTNESARDDGDPLASLDDNEWASWTYMSGDWNGGCHGSGRGGSRYYRFGMSMKEVVGRMTMYGLVGEGDERRDITNGDVHGVHYEESGGAKAWYKNDAPTGFPWLHRNPTHL